MTMTKELKMALQSTGMSLKEIAEQSGLHPSTAHRILNDMTIGRFVERPEPGSYRLGMRLLELGNLVKGRLNVRDAALTPMRELHKQIQQPVNLSMRQGDEIIYVERAYSERSGMQVVRAIGQPFVMLTLSNFAMAGISPKDMPSASSLFNMTRNLGGSIGIAMLASMLTNRQHFHALLITAPFVFVVVPLTCDIADVDQRILLPGTY